MMIAILIPTNRMFQDSILPLLELGFETFEEALEENIINVREFSFLTKQFGYAIPSYEQFQNIQQDRLNSIPQ